MEPGGKARSEAVLLRDLARRPGHLRLLQIGAVVGPILVLMVAALGLWLQEREAVESDIRDSLEIVRQYVGRLAESQALLLDQVDYAVRDRAWSDIASSEALHTRLGELTARSDVVVSMALIDENGRLRLTDRVFPVEPVDLSDRDYVRALRNGSPNLAIGDRITSRVLNEDLFILARRRGGDGFNGVIALGVGVEPFRSFFEGLRKDARTTVSLVRADGAVLVRSPDAPAVTLPPGSPFDRATHAAPAGFYEATALSDGVHRLFGYRQIGDLPVFAAYGVATAALWERWAASVSVAAAIAFMVAAFGYVMAGLAVQSQRDEEQFRRNLQKEVDERTAHLRKAEEQQRLLMREVDHRAKNALAVVQSLVRLTKADSREAFIEAVTGRVAALARTHSLLAENRWRGADLGALIAEEMAPYQQGRSVQVSLSGPTVTVAAEAVQALGMVIHELATNAAKYGALSVPGGKVTVAWRRAEDRALRVTWQEEGGPPVRVPAHLGFGSAMISGTVANQLGGRVDFEWLDRGLRCTMTVGDAWIGGTAERHRSTAEAALEAAGRDASLDGCRVLVVEDDPLIAIGMAEDLRGLGCVTIGPAATVEEGVRLAAGEPDLDLAVLDVNLRGQEVWPVVDALKKRAVPFLFVTGYADATGDHSDAPVLAKPLSPERLEAALRTLKAAR